jgi:uncharacterized membrane protein YcaP (DUF421 family)
MNEALQFTRDLLGLGNEPLQLSFLQITARAIIVFIASIAMVRVANKRFMARLTPFDTVLGFILASMLSRGINGTAPLFPTLGAGFVLVGLHRLVARIAQHSHRFSVLVKGHSEVVVRDGVVQEAAMRKHHLSQHDLLEELRLEGKVESPEQVKQATLERNGKISVIPQGPQ